MGAAVSYATGNDALTGGVSAGSGEATAPLLSQFLYGTKDSSKLNAEQKDTISAITSALGAGIGLTTGNASDAANAAETSKVAVENNYYFANLKNIHKFTEKQVKDHYELQESNFKANCSKGGGGNCNNIIRDMIAFTDNSYVKSEYGALRNETLAKLKSNPELIITYLDSEDFKLNKADQSVLNTQLKPILQATGGGFGVVGSITGTAYACTATAGLGCYAAAIAGSAGATSSFDHVKTGYNNYGKPLSQQSSGDLIKNLKVMGFSDQGARNIQLAADILGTGGLGYSVAANKVVSTTGKYATSSTNAAKNTEYNVWHSTATPNAADNILTYGINPIYLNPESRFGKAFYVAEQPKTSLAEMGHYGVDPSTGIRFTINDSKLKILDLTKSTTAKKWGYSGGEKTTDMITIGNKAKNGGYNAIRFKTERASGGVNIAIIDDYNEVLKPAMVTPVKK